MSERTQHSVSFLIAPTRVLLILATVTCLLCALAGRGIGLPVQAERAVAADTTSSPAGPTPATVTKSTSPLATPEPTVNDPTETSSSPRPEARLEGSGEAPVEVPTATPSPAPTFTAMPREHTIQEGDTQEPSPTAVPSEPMPTSLPASPAAIGEGRWIDVDLSEQVLTAYEGRRPVRTTLVSTGLPNTPTPVGQFHIWIKLRTDDMAGADYYIKDVPYVMYFHGGYGLHGVTWHGNFGHPMSHGCVNLPTEEARWLFYFADVGTLVNIHG